MMGVGARRYGLMGLPQDDPEDPMPVIGGGLFGRHWTDPAQIFAQIDASRPRQPMDERPYNSPDYSSFPVSSTPHDPVTAPDAPEKKKGGFDFGTLGAMILAANGNPLGQFALQAMNQRKQADYQARLREQQRRQTMDDQWSLWQREQQFQRDNPQPTQLMRDRASMLGLVQSGQLQQSDFDNWWQNQIDPPRWMQVDNPATGGKDIIPFNRNGPISGQTGQPRGLTTEELDAMEGGAGRSGPRPFR